MGRILPTPLAETLEGIPWKARSSEFPAEVAHGLHFHTPRFTDSRSGLSVLGTDWNQNLGHRGLVCSPSLSVAACLVCSRSRSVAAYLACFPH